MYFERVGGKCSTTESFEIIAKSVVFFLSAMETKHFVFVNCLCFLQDTTNFLAEEDT